MNDSRQPKPETSSDVSSRALSRRTYGVMLIVHTLAGLVWLATLASFLTKFGELFVRLQQKSELPALTEFVMRLSPHSLWLLALGLAFEATVLYVLGCLPRRQGWLAVAWFSLVLIGMIALDGLTILFLYLPILKMSTPI